MTYDQGTKCIATCTPYLQSKTMMNQTSSLYQGKPAIKQLASMYPLYGIKIYLFPQDVANPQEEEVFAQILKRTLLLKWRPGNQCPSVG